MANIFLFLLLVASNEAGGGCTEGFMDLSLLVAKAATPVGSLADNTLADSNEGRWIIGYDTFNCSTAAVTEILFGVDIRSKHGIRNKYPNIDIWRRRGSYYYQLQIIPIPLSPDNFTTNGLYHYVLPTPFNINSNIYNRYRLGVYQPEDDSSVVRLYRATTSSTETVGRLVSNVINFENTNNVFMIHLKTGM